MTAVDSNQGGSGVAEEDGVEDDGRGRPNYVSIEKVSKQNVGGDHPTSIDYAHCRGGLAS